MEMKTFKRILIIFSRVLIVVAVIAGVVYALKSDDGICNNIVVNIKGTTDVDRLMTEGEVEKLIGKDGIVGKRFGDIDLLKIERKVKGMKYVKSVNAVAGISGDLNINITEHKIIARLINENGDSMYLTADSSKLIGVSKNGSVRVPIVMGKIGFNDKKKISDLELLIREIDKNDFMKSYVQQIIVDDDRRYSIVGLVGNHIVELGRLDNLKDKFERLERFYENGLNKVGWDKYRIISVEFDSQVVCK